MDFKYILVYLFFTREAMRLLFCVMICVNSKSWFLSCFFFSTRESLASNTSSIVESNRRQNPALSPGHMGTTSIGPPFSFRAIPEPPTTQPEKLQKSPNCLASITSVWHGPIWGDVRPGWSAMLGCLSAGGWVTPSIKHLDYMGTVKPTGMTSRDCSYSIKKVTAKKGKKRKNSKGNFSS